MSVQKVLQMNSLIPLKTEPLINSKQNIENLMFFCLMIFIFYKERNKLKRNFFILLKHYTMIKNRWFLRVIDLLLNLKIYKIDCSLDFHAVCQLIYSLQTMKHGALFCK